MEETPSNIGENSGKDPKTGRFVEGNTYGQGRPVGVKNFSTLFKEAVKKIAEANGIPDDTIEVDLVRKAIKEAKAGNFKFYEDTMNRLYGKAPQSLDITTGGEKIIGINYIIPNGNNSNSNS